MRNEDIIMTLLESLSPLYKHLITALETMSIKQLIKEYLRARLMHMMLKRKEMEPQSDDVAMVLYQNKGDNSYSCNVTTLASFL